MGRKTKQKRRDDGRNIFDRNGRWYADLRGFSDVLPSDHRGREALAPEGSSWGTADEEVAKALYDARMAELVGLRRKRAGVPQSREQQSTTLDVLVQHHLQMKAEAGGTSRSHMSDLESRLRAAIEHFGAKVNPRDIVPEDVRAWSKALAEGGKRKPGTVRHYLNALSGLYRRAAEGQWVEQGYNPVAALVEKPSGWSGRAEAKSFEVHEAALLLEAARVVEARDRVNATPGLHAIVATLLLTGGRWSEVAGLDVEDVSFDRGLVYFRPNAHRGLKTKTSRRDVPIWPQLHEILQAHMFGGEDGPQRTSGLLFPASARTGGGMVRDLRKSLDEMGKLCGMREGEVRTKAFRHTYCSARLQTVTTILRPGHRPTDPDAWTYEPVSHDAVAREMGHGGTELVKRIYGHRARDPHRANEVAYRVEEHQEKLGERLRFLQVVGVA